MMACQPMGVLHQPQLHHHHHHHQQHHTLGQLASPQLASLAHNQPSQQTNHQTNEQQNVNQSQNRNQSQSQTQSQSHSQSQSQSQQHHERAFHQQQLASTQTHYQARGPTQQYYQVASLQHQTQQQQQQSPGRLDERRLAGGEARAAANYTPSGQMYTTLSLPPAPQMVALNAPPTPPSDEQLAASHGHPRQALGQAQHQQQYQFLGQQQANSQPCLKQQQVQLQHQQQHQNRLQTGVWIMQTRQQVQQAASPVHSHCESELRPPEVQCYEQQQQQQAEHITGYYYDIDDGFSDIVSAPPTPEPSLEQQQQQVGGGYQAAGQHAGAFGQQAASAYQLGSECGPQLAYRAQFGEGPPALAHNAQSAGLALGSHARPQDQLRQDQRQDQQHQQQHSAAAFLCRQQYSTAMSPESCASLASLPLSTCSVSSAASAASSPPVSLADCAVYQPQGRPQQQQQQQQSRGAPTAKAKLQQAGNAATGTTQAAHHQRSSPIHLWEFLKELLQQVDEGCADASVIRWLDRQRGVFKIEDSVRVAKLWGKRKNKPKMNYDKLSRSIRQYYKKGIMKKTDRSQRLVYQFCSAYCH